MDVDGPANVAEQPIPAAEDEQTSWEIEKAELERTQFNLNKEVSDLRERVEDLSRQNGQLLTELGRYGTDVKNHVSRQRELEQARNDLTNKNLELETIIARLNIEKGEREAAIVNATKEAQTALVETHSLKDQLRQLTNEKAALTHSVEAAQQERQCIEFERQKYATERDLYTESKRWLMNEVSERDNKVSSLRLELSNKDLEGANERIQYESQINFLNTQIERLNEKVDMLQFSNSDLVKKMEATELAKNTEVANMEEEIRCLNDLQKILKNSLEETKSAADHFRDQLDAQEGVLAEVRSVLQENQEDMERERLAHAEAIRQKDEELAQTQSELGKVNDMIKSMSDVKLNVSEEELAELAPAAAETVRFLKGGQSLSSLVLEHARVCGKFAEIEQENANLRSTLEDLLEAINQNKPQLLSQRMVADELFDKTGRFEKQLEQVEVERKELVAQRDTAQRDLAYVRAELEKYQRDYDFVTKRNAELMYAVERQSRMNDPNWNEQADEQLFLNCVQLQRRNVELESDIENAKTSAAQAAMNAQSEEMAQLKADLAFTKKSEAELKTKVEQTKAAFDSLKERTEHFKELVRDSVSASEARVARLKAEEAIAARIVADATIARLRTQEEELKADYQRREQELEQRIQSTEASINNVTETNIKLNAMLDAQKANTTAMEQEYKTAIKEKETAFEELRKVTVANGENERKLVDLGRQALEATDQAGTLRVRVRGLEDELQIARTEVTSLRMTSNGQKMILEKEEQVRSSVIEMANFLSRVEAEKLTHANTQLDMIKQERDSLKASASRLNDQFTHSKNEAKLIQQRLEKEIEIVRNILKEKEEQLSRDEAELSDLRSKLASVQGQFTDSDATGMAPDRLKREYVQLKNRVHFLENELDSANRKLMEAEAAQKRMDAEHAISASHNNVLEENLKQTEEMGSMERERLQKSLKFFEDRAQQVTDQLGQAQTDLNELRNKHDDLVIKSERDAAEFQRQLQVAALNMDGVRRELEVANTNLLNAQNEISRNASALEQHNTIVYQFEQKISEIENASLRLQAELNNKVIALAAETTAKNEADQMREHTERLLRQKTEELEKLSLESSQKQNEYEEKLTQLSHQYESLSSNNLSVHSSSMETSEISTEPSSTHIQSLQSMIQFLRQAKDEATQRAMNAEIEMRRLRAETAEFERGKNELLQKIRDLELEKVATAASLIDKAKLVEKVESMTNVHNINAQLKEEIAKLQAQAAQFHNEKMDLQKQISAITAKISEQNLKIASSNQEALQRKREIELLKQRAEASVRGPAAALQTQLDQMKTQLAAARQEATNASQQAQLAEKAKIKAEKSFEDQGQKLNQTRRLAIKFREELTALKASLETAGTGGDPCAGRLAALSKTHNEQVEQINADKDAQIAQLNSKIEEINKETENLRSQAMRTNLLEKRLKLLTEQNNELKQQHAKLAESNRQLSQSRSASATDVESKSASTSAVKPPVIRHTPTKAADPNSGKQFSSANVVPPAPAPSNISQQHQPKTSPDKRPVPPSIPNELMDIIPPVPSDNIPVVPDPTPPTNPNTFGSMLPVPHTFQTTARVPTQSLFSSSSTTTVQPKSDKKNVLPNIDSAPATPGSNVTVSQATSSLTSVPTFNNPPTNISTVPVAETLTLPEESVIEGAAGQSSLVSGSIDQKEQDVELAANDGESRDSTTAGGVSSSEGRRKRTANDFDTNEAKRLRESPNEAVTSSETRQQSNIADIPELDDDDGVLNLEHEVSDEDPNDNTNQEERDDVIDLENDEEVLEDEMEEEGDDDESYGNDEDYEDEQKVQQNDDDEIVVILSDDDAPEEDADNDEESLNDVEEVDDDVEEIEMVEESNNAGDIEEVLGGEDSQPSLEDQDREAASAVEEAEDEGRDPLGTIDEPIAPADPTGASGSGNVARMAQDVQRVRLPTGLREAEREDQCSSSNETNEERPGSRPTGAGARLAQRQPMRGAKPTRGVYRPGRGRGRGG